MEEANKLRGLIKELESIFLEYKELYSRKTLSLIDLSSKYLEHGICNKLAMVNFENNLTFISIYPDFQFALICDTPFEICHTNKIEIGDKTTIYHESIKTRIDWLGREIPKLKNKMI